MVTKQRIGNDNTERAAVPTSFPRFSPTCRFGLSTKRRENLGTRLLGFKLGFVPVFHFPVPVLVTCLKNLTLIILFIRKRATGSRQLFLRYIRYIRYGNWDLIRTSSAESPGTLSY